MDDYQQVAKRMRGHVKAIQCVHVLRNCARARLSVANRVARLCREYDDSPYTLLAADKAGQRALGECGRWSNALRRLRAYEYFPRNSA
jgi:hypothetical protein